MDKVERLISIIMILLKKDVVTTKEFARLFNVSKRTILRDMETLSLSNILSILSMEFMVATLLWMNIRLINVF